MTRVSDAFLQYILPLTSHYMLSQYIKFSLFCAAVRVKDVLTPGGLCAVHRQPEPRDRSKNRREEPAITLRTVPADLATGTTLL